MEPSPRNYWDRYYEVGASPEMPSTFFRVVSDLVAHPSLVIDIGCGNGRDTSAWARRAPTVGLDASEMAVARARTRVEGFEDPPEFRRFIVGQDDLGLLVSELATDAIKLIVTYCRFFLHAIPEIDQRDLMSQVRRLSERHDVVLACEFRTTEDSMLPKTNSGHYRRFIDRQLFSNALRDDGWTLLLERHGQDLAVFGSENPYVAQIVATRSRRSTVSGD